MHWYWHFFNLIIYLSRSIDSVCVYVSEWVRFVNGIGICMSKWKCNVFTKTPESMHTMSVVKHWRTEERLCRRSYSTLVLPSISNRLIISSKLCTWPEKWACFWYNVIWNYNPCIQHHNEWLNELFNSIQNNFRKGTFDIRIDVSLFVD